MEELVARGVALPGGDLQILQPAESAELPDDMGIEWAPIAPYWSVLWRSGAALAEELDGARLEGKRVLELGCGLGMPSLVAARQGASVLAADREPEALELLARNARMNELTLETTEVEWAEAEALVDRGPFDLVVAADVLYVSESADLLLALLPRLADKVCIADPGRGHTDAFLRRAGRHWTIDTQRRDIVSLHWLTARSSAF